MLTNIRTVTWSFTTQQVSVSDLNCVTHWMTELYSVCDSMLLIDQATNWVKFSQSPSHSARHTITHWVAVWLGMWFLQRVTHWVTEQFIDLHCNSHSDSTVVKLPSWLFVGFPGGCPQLLDILLDLTQSLNHRIKLKLKRYNSGVTKVGNHL